MENAGGSPNKARETKQIPFARRAGVYLGVAFELPGTIVAGILIGYFLDDYFETSPWLLLAITAIAFAGAFFRLIRWVRFFASRKDGSNRKEDYSQH